MYIDKQLEFSDAQAPTVTFTVTTASTNIVDTISAKNSLPALYFLLRVNTAVTSDGGATVTFVLQTDGDEAFGSPVTLWTAAAVSKTTLVAGYTVAKFPLPISQLERYLRVTYLPNTADLTAGKFDAALVMDLDA